MTQAFLYKWTGKSTGKWYIGSRTAKDCHPNDGYICSSKVVKPLIESNPANWAREVLVIGGRQYICDLEVQYLLKLDAADDEMSYNQTNGRLNFYNTGKVNSDETRRKMSLAAKRRKPPSDETRRKIGSAQKGKVNSDETRRKMSFAHKNPSDETRRKIGLAQKEKVNSDETRRKMSLAHKGMKHSEESKRKMSLAKKGKSLPPLTEEHKRKLSLAKRKFKLSTHKNIYDDLFE